MARRGAHFHPDQFVINFDDPDEIYSRPPASTRRVDTSEQEADPRLFYISFGSGSSGNSCYIGSSQGGFLIDAGVNDVEIEEGLRRNNIPMSRVKAVLLTHDHTDHIKYVYKLLRSNKNLRLYCTNRVMIGILRKHNISKRIKEFHNPIFKEIPFRILDFEITAFEVPHDGSDNVGYSIVRGEKRFVLATDLGAVTERAHFYMSQANYLVIESNYDLQMLLKGRYPEYLKERILTEHGHLDNTVTASFLAQIASPALSHIFLCHLSQDNNTPGIAVSASRRALEAKGFSVGDSSESIEDRAADIHLTALPRTDATRLFMLR